MRRRIPALALTAMFGSAVLAAPASAGELYGGVYVHAVETPFTFDTEEGGADLQAGYRFDPVLGAARIEPYVFASLNTQGDTNFGGVGVSRKFSLGPVYVRPGVGLVVHDAPSYRVGSDGIRTDLGSRVLFEPELAIGTAIGPRLSIEASWVHISNAQVFNSEQNPGIDTMGVRLNLAL